MKKSIQFILFLCAMICAQSATAAEQASAFTLRDINRKSVSLSDYEGKVVLMSFWTTWCGPCKVEMPHLNALYEEKKDEGFVVLSISNDDARSSSQVKPYIRKMRYSFPVLLDTDSKVTGVYNPLKTLPYTVILDRDHNIVATHSGYNPGDEEHIKKEIEALLTK